MSLTKVNNYDLVCKLKNVQWLLYIQFAYACAKSILRCGLWKPIATISFPRSRVPEDGEKTRRRENERARKRENELVFSFSRNNNSTQKLRKNAATRIRTIESATHAKPCFRFRVPAPLFVSLSAPLSVSFPRPSLFRFLVLVTYRRAANPRKEL